MHRSRASCARISNISVHFLQEKPRFGELRPCPIAGKPEKSVRCAEINSLLHVADVAFWPTACAFSQATPARPCSRACLQNSHALTLRIQFTPHSLSVPLTQASGFTRKGGGGFIACLQCARRPSYLRAAPRKKGVFSARMLLTCYMNN